MCKKTVFDLQKEGTPQNLVVILKSKWSLQYEASRAISNAKFDYKPSGIAYCKNVQHVQYCINFCRENAIDFRIRSGGHQHEGMCSGNNLLVIDLSEMNQIEYIPDTNEAWLPVGKQLQYVYQELEKKDFIIPGGGCQSVNVGGLTHGGGWGVSIRKLGFTCDNILEAEMVLANGQIVYPSPTNFPDLFWGLKGAGGGNLGIVTRFRFKLTPLKGDMTSFSLVWKNPDDAQDAILHWTKMQRDTQHDLNLSTACRMSLEAPLKDSGKKNIVLSRMGGQYYGSEADLEEVLRFYFKELFDKGDFNATTKHFKSKAEEATITPKTLEYTQTTPEIGLSLADAQKYVAELLNPTDPMADLKSLFEISFPDKEEKCEPIGKNLPDAPGVTCDRPHPHKVTSCFPKCGNEADGQDSDKELVAAIHKYLSDSCYYKDVSRYMSFHCMGGVITENPSSRVFPYADRPYMLQVQTWWNLSENKSVDENRKVAYKGWVEKFRAAIQPWTEGAFINFVDKDIFGPYEPSKRQEILTAYYTEQNLKKLIPIKKRYDPFNLFNFRLSVPLEYQED